MEIFLDTSVVIDYFYPYAQPNAERVKLVQEFVNSNKARNQVIIPREVLKEIETLIKDALSQVSDLMHKHIIDNKEIDWDAIELSERLKVLQDLIDNYDAYLEELSKDRRIRTTQFRRAFGKRLFAQYKTYLSNQPKKKLEDIFNDELADRLIKEFERLINYSLSIKVDGIEKTAMSKDCLNKIISILKDDHDFKILLEVIFKHANHVNEDYSIVTMDQRDFYAIKKKLDNIECLNKIAGLDKIRIETLSRSVQ